MECNEPSDYCYCNRCVRATIRCDTRRENNKTIEMLIRVNGRWHYGTIKKVYKRFPRADPPYSRFDLVVKERGRKKILKYLWVDIDEVQPAEKRSS